MLRNGGKSGSVANGKILLCSSWLWTRPTLHTIYSMALQDSVSLCRLLTWWLFWMMPTVASDVEVPQPCLNSCNFFYSSAERVTVHFINRDGEKLTAIAKEGESLLDVVVNQNLGIDGFGRCNAAITSSLGLLHKCRITNRQLGL